MPKHVVRQGECVAVIAARHGLTPDDLIAMNGALMERRDDAYILGAGDLLEVPEPSGRDRAPFSSGGTRRYRAQVPTTPVRVRVVDEAGAAVAGRRFLFVAGRIEREGQTDGDGHAEAELPVRVTEVDLRVWFPEEDEPRVFAIALGHLDPSSETSGVRQRLVNLGYLTAATADEEALARALRAFQTDQGLTVTGELDDATRERLVDRHGS